MSENTKKNETWPNFGRDDDCAVTKPSLATAGYEFISSISRSLKAKNPPKYHKPFTFWCIKLTEILTFITQTSIEISRHILRRLYTVMGGVCVRKRFISHCQPLHNMGLFDVDCD